MSDEEGSSEAVSEHKPCHLFTWFWKDALKYEGDDVVLVRTSIGSPRWVPKEVTGAMEAMHELMPYGCLGKDLTDDSGRPATGAGSTSSASTRSASG